MSALPYQPTRGQGYRSVLQTERQKGLNEGTSRPLRLVRSESDLAARVGACFHS